jgi:hypothetical protein
MRNQSGSDVFRNFLTNMDAPYPFWTKMRMLVRNLSLRVIKLQTCCGHEGEPGC